MRLARFKSYFRTGFHFEKLPAASPVHGSLILIHGWSDRAVNLQYLGNYFRHQGYDVWLYDYPTSKLSVAEHGDEFLRLYRKLQLTLPIHFITHSMGGIVLRRVLSQMTGDERKKLDRVIMLAPPNQGSRWADLTRYIPFAQWFNRSLPDLATASDSAVHTIKMPLDIPEIGIIQAGRDALVAPEHLPLPNHEIPIVEVDRGHNGLLFSPEVCRLAKNFLSGGQFTAPDDSKQHERITPIQL